MTAQVNCLRFLAHLRFEKNAGVMIDEMMSIGMDHHMLIKEGDHTKLLSTLCGYMEE